ncbi:amino acid permease [Helicobacter saguini]|uniref:Amino acid permease n=1 Tax=Helicobacter saguini TaxID=1548018 RepID=A0A347VMZ8_9HELI|nr:aromatic amino acid transport family protein [Helicobacter saguini]MWV61960.1 amino acid permease [Helicobacter saguini]MWV67365.1 amino acid permease [Helicobacter saguini]MWV69718.1 amino acid permease [Helicobacter saguini]MWV73065.1 amino acid permease [Helicobacter saguini]TLD95562.1 amino acid permease [Helicobacter saguini]
MKLKEIEQEFISELKGHPKTKKLTFLEGVSMLVGTNIGIGILSIAHTAKHAGFFPLLFWLVIGGILSTITMLYIAEATLRTKAHLQLTGLSVRYIGPVAKYLMFISVAVTSYGALTAYEKAAGDVMHDIFGVPHYLGSLLFFIPAAGVLWLGLKAIGRGEKQVVGIMFVILVVLIIATFFKADINFANTLEMHWSLGAILPIFNTVVFVYSSQYIVPEMARGFSHKPTMLPKAILLGNFITFAMLALVPLSAIVLEGLSNISEVVTLSWGRAIGDWAFIIANLFGLFAILTSYWGLGGMFITNIADQLNKDADNNLRLRFFILLFVSLPPLFFVLLRVADSIQDAIYWPGVVGALILSFFPILILQNSRKKGDMQASWVCPAFLTTFGAKATIVIVYLSATVFSIAAKYGFLDKLIAIISG